MEVDILKKKVITLMILTMIFTMGCSNSKNNIKEEGTGQVSQGENNIEQQEEEKPVEEFTTFEALNMSYEKNKSLSELAPGTEVFNNTKENVYVQGEYVEVDFANDLIMNYLSGNTDVSNCVVSIEENKQISLTQEDKNRLDESLTFLKEQMGVTSDSPIYFRLNSVVYEGGKEGEPIVLNMKGHVSIDGSYFASLANYTVTIFTDGNKIYGHIV